MTARPFGAPGMEGTEELQPLSPTTPRAKLDRAIVSVDLLALLDAHASRTTNPLRGTHDVASASMIT
ncbi:hypothetical protein DFJ73DRAFT_774985 [Zopfochytrium polystomum]|nr:hypothetical protein DFJ73DRAFT_774985 [Zopfochytrium polystomum]